MEVHFNPDLQAKLDKLAIETGRPPGELVEDVVAGYFDELVGVREMLNGRYDDLKSGRVKPIRGDDKPMKIEQSEDSGQKHRSIVDPSILRGPPKTRDGQWGGGAGMKSAGLYPEVSRTKLARNLGMSVSTVSCVLSGRQKPTLELAWKMAEAIGVTVDRLARELEGKQREREKERG